jgi:hypothetical protein
MIKLDLDVDFGAPFGRIEHAVSTAAVRPVVPAMGL